MRPRHRLSVSVAFQGRVVCVRKWDRASDTLASRIPGDIHAPWRRVLLDVARPGEG